MNSPAAIAENYCPDVAARFFLGFLTRLGDITLGNPQPPVTENIASSRNCWFLPNTHKDIEQIIVGHSSMLGFHIPAFITSYIASDFHLDGA